LPAYDFIRKIHSCSVFISPGYQSTHFCDTNISFSDFFNYCDLLNLFYAANNPLCSTVDHDYLYVIQFNSSRVLIPVVFSVLTFEILISLHIMYITIIYVLFYTQFNDIKVYIDNIRFLHMGHNNSTQLKKLSGTKLKIYN
jgi:hypothetical protein